jgi:type I restriction enzyme R subunit
MSATGPSIICGGRCWYFDDSIIGLTATPSKETFGYFKRNLVMEYTHENVVADGVNVGCDIYRIRTQITRAQRAGNSQSEWAEGHTRSAGWRRRGRVSASSRSGFWR